MVDPNAAPFFKIDLHTHILPERWPDLRERYGYGGWVQLEHHHPCCAQMMIDGKTFREIESNCWDPRTAPRLRRDRRRRAGALDGAGDVQLLGEAGGHPRPRPPPERPHRRGVPRAPAALRRTGHAADAGPGAGGARARRCVQELGLPGIQIGTHVNELEPRRAELFPVFEAAAELGAAVFVHPWDMMGQSEMCRYWLPWLVGMPAETSCAICSMIFGGVLRAPAGRCASGSPTAAARSRSRSAASSTDSTCGPTSAPWTTTSIRASTSGGSTSTRSCTTQTPCGISCISSASERIALGSDYPFPLGEHRPGQLIESMDDLAPSTKRRLLGGTALEFLGVSADRFGGPPASAGQTRAAEPRPLDRGSLH